MVSFDKREEITSVFGLDLKSDVMKEVPLYYCQTLWR